MLAKNLHIFTIGYGSRRQNDFLSLLQKVEVEYVIDVRSLPHSKFNPTFNQNELKFFLRNYGVKYVYMGDTLGGRPQDRSCYDTEGRVNYEILRKMDFFLSGIGRIKKANSLRLKVALMCSEAKPYECHRSKLIGQVLNEEGIPLGHIDEDGLIRDQVYVMNCVGKGSPENDLFGDKLKTRSRNRYS
jgi:uncharacterized protein (DUF488 family)